MKVMMFFFLGLMIVAFLALAVHDIRVSQANHDANGDILCYWTLVRKRIEPGNDENCIPAVAKNLIVGDPIRVCNIVSEYDSIVTAAVSKWNTAFSPSPGTKIAPKDIFLYDSGDCTNHQSDSDKIASIVVKAGVRAENSGDPDQCDGTPGCAVPAFVKDYPNPTYTGQGIIYIFPTEIEDTIIAAGKKKTMGNEKSLAIAHEMGHFLGFNHPVDHVSRRNICPEMGSQIPIISIMTTPETSGDLSRTWLCTSEISQYDENRYKQVYTPDDVSDFGARSVTGLVDTVSLTWNAANVHVEKEFEIQRCASFNAQGPTCTKSVGTWTKVKTVSANTSPTDRASGATTSGRIFDSPIILRGAETGSRAKEMFRVVSRTDALTTAIYEAEAATAGQTVTVVRRTAAPTATETPTTPVGGRPETPGDDGSEEEEEEEEEENGDDEDTDDDSSDTTSPSPVASPTTTTSPSPETSPTTTTATATATATATVAPVRYCRLRFVVGSGAGRFTTNPRSGVVQCGERISYWATARTGYCFSRWGGASLGASGQASCRSSSGVQSIASLTADFTFTAHFTKKRYTLRITSSSLRTGAGGSAGSVSPSPGTHTYAHGTRVTITATGLFGSVWNWGGACSGSGSTCTVVMNGPKSVSVTFSPGGAGGFEEEEGTVTPTATATATATPTVTPTPTASATSTPAATPVPSGPSGQ